MNEANRAGQFYCTCTSSCTVHVLVHTYQHMRYALFFGANRYTGETINILVVSHTFNGHRSWYSLLIASNHGRVWWKVPIAVVCHVVAATLLLLLLLPILYILVKCLSPDCWGSACRWECDCSIQWAAACQLHIAHKWNAHTICTLLTRVRRVRSAASGRWNKSCHSQRLVELNWQRSPSRPLSARFGYVSLLSK